MKEYHHLTKEIRYFIIQEIQKKISKKIIAEHLGISRATLYRELKRNRDSDGNYRHDHADSHSRKR